MTKLMDATLAVLLVVGLSACGAQKVESSTTVPPINNSTVSSSEEAVSSVVAKDSSEEVVDSSKNEIVLSNNGIKIDGKDISVNPEDDVYAAKVIETHPDITEETKGIENTVVVITQPGQYRVSGKMEDVQLKVDIEPTIEAHTNIILDGVNITNRTAPAILIDSALKTNVVGYGSVTLTLWAESENIITGSHIAEYNDATGREIDYDGAISSAVSFTIDGTGSLILTADKEGIETLNHLTIENGRIDIRAMDDAINANEDDVSHITINGGYIIANSTFGKEGDGIDSNGYVTINGGTILAFANENSMDSGIDSDLGITINGGTVVATGNMYDEVSASSPQTFITLNTTSGLSRGETLAVLDSSDTPIMVFQVPYKFSQMVFSSPELKGDEAYSFYRGGEVVGKSADGLYTAIDSYTKGEVIENRPAGGFSGGPGGRPTR